MLKAELKNGHLHLVIPFDEAGKVSGSQKNLVHASTGGNQPTEVTVNGNKLYVGLNAYSANPNYVKK